MQQSYKEFIKGSERITMRTIISAAKKNVPCSYASEPWSYPSLHRGKAVLDDEDSLNCYMSAYGQMHTVKMQRVLGRLPAVAVRDDFEIVDWGCGQGLATICLLDMLEKALPFTCPEHVTLVDASSAALSRALMNVSLKLKGRVAVRAVETRLSPDELRGVETWHGAPVVVHLLSNILDVPGVSNKAMADAISSSGVVNYIVYAGHSKTEKHFKGFCENFRRCDMRVLFHQNKYVGDCLPNGYSYGWDLGVIRLITEPEANVSHVA